MKKLVYGGLFLALVGIGFSGCKKEENGISERSTGYKIINKIEHLNVEFDDCFLLNKAAPPSWGKRLAADALGAIGGSRWGSAIGGFPWGTGIGAAVGAGAASYYAGISNDNSYSDSILNKVRGYDVEVELPNLNNNENDSIGRLHNMLLRNLILNNPIHSKEKSLSTLFENIYLSEVEKDILSQLQDDFFCFFLGEKNYDDICNFLRIKLPESEFSILVMEKFFEKALQFTNHDKFNEYLSSFEKIIMDADITEISDVDKKQVLISLSIAKYSGHFWGFVLSN